MLDDGGVNFSKPGGAKGLPPGGPEAATLYVTIKLMEFYLRWDKTTDPKKK